MNTSRKMYPQTEWYIVLSAMAALAGLLSFRLGWQDYWQDEYFTLMFTRFDWGELVGEHWGTDTHRPVYYALQKAWMAVFGDSIVAARALPVTLSVLLVPLFYDIARRTGPKPMALIVLILLVTVPMLILQGRSLRMYALSNLALTAALWCAVVLADRLRTTRPRRDTQSDLPLWAGFVTTLAVAFYAQAFGILVFALFGLWILACVGLRILPVAFLTRALLALIVYLVLIVPALAPFFTHAAGTLGGDFWIPEPSLRFVYGQITGAYPYPWWAKPVVALMILWGLWCLRGRPHLAWLFGMMVIGLPALVLAVSFYKPIFLSRVIAWGSIVAVLVISAGLVRLPPGPRWCAVGFMIGAQTFTYTTLIPSAPEYGTERQLADEIRDFDPATDTLLLGGRSLEVAFHWLMPKVFERPVYVFSDRNRYDAVDRAAYQADFVPLEDAGQLTLENGTAYVITVQPRTPTSVPEAERAATALAQVTAQLPLARSVRHGRLRVEVFAVP